MAAPGSKAEPDEARTRGVAVINAAGLVITHKRSFPSTLGKRGPVSGRSLCSLVVEADREPLAEALELARTRPGMTLALHADTNGRLLQIRLAWLSATNEIVAEAIPTPLSALPDAGSLSNLVAGVAHDFNNLLTVIQANLREARDLADEDQERPLEDAQRAVESAAGLSRRLMALGRARESDLGPVALQAVLSDLESLLRTTVAPSVSVEVASEPGLHALNSPAELEQVLLNLAVNGAEAMPAGGRLLIAADTAPALASAGPAELPERPDGYVRIRVHDEGVGMDAATRSRALEPYFSTKGASGTGLGLAMAQQLVAGQGGTISFESAPGRGTTATVVLPKTLSAAGAVRESLDLALGAMAREVGTRVLVVDDRAGIRAACVAMLGEAGYAVEEAADGTAATTRAESWRPAVVVLDATMPGLSGTATFEALSRIVPGIRAVFISGFGDEALAGLETSERWTFLPKPFDRETLLSAVTRVLAPVEDLAS